MRPSRQWVLLLVLIATGARAEGYQKAGPYMSTLHSLTDFTFFGIGGQYEIGRVVGAGELGAEFRLAYHFYEDDSYAYNRDDKAASIVPIEMGLKYSVPMDNRLVPYAAVGMGMYWFDDDSSCSYDPILGFYGALGCEYRLKKLVGFFFQLKFTQATDDIDGCGFGTKYGVDGLGGDLGALFRF